MKLVCANFIFCNDPYLIEINKAYLSHDTFTDIITFDNSDSPDSIETDIFISIERVKENAAIQNTEFIKELYRVMIHGILHLLGYRDKTSEEKKIMREQENIALEDLYGSIDI